MKSKTEKLLTQLIDLHPKYIDLSLTRLSLLLNKIGNPHLRLPQTIHIAGTNGKGSTLSFIKEILINNGYSCHAYISPHLFNFKERIVLNNKEINTLRLYNVLQYVKKQNQENPITFFEITTAAAFLLFSKYKADFLILETGLGGRLDATNIIQKKLLSIITPISIDHEEFLGKTLNKITKEKLAITKNSKKIIISKQKLEVEKYIKYKLKNNKNVYYYKNDYKFKDTSKSKFLFKFKNEKHNIHKPKLLGKHQLENASVAITSSLVLKNLGYKINYKYLNKSIKNTYWPGRLEIIKFKNKKIIFDGSHNVEGAKKLNLFLKEKKIKPLVLFGMLNNKKIYEFLKTIKYNIEKILAVKIPNEKNAFTSVQIKIICNKLLLNCVKIKNINQIKKQISSCSNRYILITGSLYLVGRIKKKLL